MYKLIEEIALNTWPAEQSVLLEGWILRSAAGYTKRANSASPLYGPGAEQGVLEIQDKIRLAEQYYTAAGQNPVFKITPFTQPPDLDGRLAGQGYVIVEPSSVRIRDMQGLPELSGRYSVQILEELTEDWLAAFAGMSELPGGHRDTLRRMLSSSSLKQGFALLLKDGLPAACGLGVIQHEYIGLYDIYTAPAFRRQGMAQELLLGLLHWAKSQGAVYSFLQVVQANAGASALYDKLAYKEIYQYWYRVKNRNWKG
ncbi:GNAT family N-acetyltransferase [Paenibacillus sp. S150]|uniref:GNAT family N-acetyltransferase n=1 Tax=Paenibacillus sp. S150 TaxID=2749826 RepID=UPI001C567BB1|nr:GNAT family N-acetyltransferase [Paenibacillus sp. S150]MBW4085004.1 GNAT family N-acetyltransferase [Paenibacillus sp. S150]